MGTLHPGQVTDLSSFLRGGTLLERCLKEVPAPNFLVIGNRHGIGGAITENAHIGPIAEALGSIRPTHVIAASPLPFENLPLTFHGDCFLARDVLPHRSQASRQ